MTRLGLAVFAFSAALAGVGAAAQAPRYTLVPVLPDALGGLATTVGDDGRVGGTVKTSDPPGVADPAQAFLWRDGAVLWQGDLGIEDALVLGVNASGLAVGSALEPAPPYDGARAGFARFADGTVRVLPSPSPATETPVSQAAAVNASGLAVGRLRGLDPEANAAFHAVTWDTNTNAITDLGTLGGAASQARDISDAGQISGFALLPDGSARAVRWVPDAAGGYTAEDLSALGGQASFGSAINAGNTVLGFVQFADGTLQLALWEPGTAGRLLAFPDGKTTCTPRDLGDGGEVVGQCGSGSARRAFVWSTDGPTSLSDALDDAPGWTILDARGVNAAGWIVGAGTRDGVVDSDGNPARFPVLLRPAGSVAREDAPGSGAVGVSAGPNPLGRAGTTLTVTHAAPGPLRIEIYDVRGRRVRTLADGPHAGGSVQWDGRDDAGRGVAVGIYLARLSTGGETATVRIAVAR